MQEAPRSRWIWLAAVALLGLGAAAVAAAPSGLLAHARHGFGHLRHGPGHGHAFSEADVDFGVRWLLRDADASEEQIAAMKAIASAAAEDLRALHEGVRAKHDALTAALLAADRGALETLRAEELARLDAASQRLAGALAEAAEVLTPAQRQRLAEAHAAHHRDD